MATGSLITVPAFEHQQEDGADQRNDGDEAEPWHRHRHRSKGPDGPAIRVLSLPGSSKALLGIRLLSKRPGIVCLVMLQTDVGWN